MTRAASPRATTTLQGELFTLLPPVVTLLALFQVATSWQAGSHDLVLAAAAVVFCQVLPGALVWRSIRPVNGWLVEDLAMGFAIGAALAVPTQIVSRIFDAGILDAAVPLVLAAALLAVPITRERIRSRHVLPLPRLWGLLTTVCTLGPLLPLLNTFHAPLHWQGFARLYVDRPYHEALAGEVLNRFPPHYPQVGLETLNYHWFSHAWTANISTISGSGVDVLLWRFNPTLLAVAVPLLTAVVAMRISGVLWAGPAAAALAYVVMGGAPWSANPVLGTALHTPESPTQQFSVLIMLAVLALLALRWRHQVSRWTVVMLVFLVVIAGGSKGSTLPVLVAGCLLASGVLFLRRDWANLRIVGLDSALAAVTTIVLNLTLFGGNTGGVKLNWLTGFLHANAGRILTPGVDPASTAGLAAGLLGIVPILLFTVGTPGLLVSRQTRWHPISWLLIGCGVSGLCAIAFLEHPGQAQWYFFKAAQIPMAMAGAWGTAMLIGDARFSRRMHPGRRIVTIGTVVGIIAMTVTQFVFVWHRDGSPGLALAALATVVFLTLVSGATWLAAHRDGWIAAAAVVAVALAASAAVVNVHRLITFEPVMSPVSATPIPAGIGSDEVGTLRWLRNHSGPDDMVMTNLHCRRAVADPCDHRQFVVAAYTQRRVLIEGWAYTRQASKAYDPASKLPYGYAPFWDPGLLRLNDGFITTPGAAAARRLYDLGVRWVVVYDRAPHADSLEPFATPKRRSEGMQVYRLNSPS